MPSQLTNLGWKAFFAVLMILNTLGTAIIWRTYDSQQAMWTMINGLKIRQEEIVIPTLACHEKAINDHVQEDLDFRRDILGVRKPAQ